MTNESECINLDDPFDFQALTQRFSSDIPSSNHRLFPDEYFNCTESCIACSSRCSKAKDHDQNHVSAAGCTFQRQYENKVFLCLRCHQRGRREVVVPKTSSANDGAMFGLMSYVWAGFVLECSSCGIIFKSRAHWYGNLDPEAASVVKTEIQHIWPGTRTLQGTTLKLLEDEVMLEQCHLCPQVLTMQDGHSWMASQSCQKPCPTSQRCLPRPCQAGWQIRSSPTTGDPTLISLIVITVAPDSHWRRAFTIAENVEKASVIPAQATGAASSSSRSRLERISKSSFIIAGIQCLNVVGWIRFGFASVAVKVFDPEVWTTAPLRIKARSRLERLGKRSPTSWPRRPQYSATRSAWSNPQLVPDTGFPTKRLATALSVKRTLTSCCGCIIAAAAARGCVTRVRGRIDPYPPEVGTLRSEFVINAFFDSLKQKRDQILLEKSILRLYVLFKT